MWCVCVSSYHILGGLRLVTPPNSDKYAQESSRQFDEAYGEWVSEWVIDLINSLGDTVNSKSTQILGSGIHLCYTNLGDFESMVLRTPFFLS